MNSSCQQAVYFIAEIVLKSTVVARFKLHHGLTVTCSEIGNKNIPPKRCGQLQNAQGSSFLPGGSLLKAPAFPSALHMPVPGFVFKKVQNRLMGGICKPLPHPVDWQLQSPPANRCTAGPPGKILWPVK